MAHHLKEIKFCWIVKIQHATVKLFEEQDDDYPDGRVIAANERAIQYWLDKITTDKTEQDKILEIIERENWNNEDITFKPICDKLRAMGYEVIS